MTKEAIKQALEALEETRNALAWFYDSYPQDVTKKGNELLPHVETVLTAMREALAEQPAQQQSCYCPNCEALSKELAAIKAQQQEPVEYVRKMIDALYENGDPVSVEAAELLERMTRQQQEPVAWGHPNSAITGRKQALMMVNLEIPSNAQYPELWVPLYTAPHVASIDTSQERVEKQGKNVHDPVAWKDKTYGNLHHQDFGNSIPLFAAPPQREWVGLTDDEIDEKTDFRATVRYFEAKLKEKNT